MAEEVTPVGYFTPTVVVASKADTANWQYLVAQVHNAGVTVADVRSLTQYGTFAHTVNSGDHASLNFGPNISKARASEAIARGNVLKPTSASGLVSVTSKGDSLAFAQAWTTAAGSGGVLSIKLF